MTVHGVAKNRIWLRDEAHTHTWFILKKVFFSGSLDMLCTLGRGRLFDQSPVEARATEFAVSFSGKQPFIRVTLTHCWRNYACSVGLHGRGLLEVCTSFPTDFVPQAFSLYWSLSADQCHESKSEVWLYAETCKSFQQITKPGKGRLGALTHTHNPIWFSEPHYNLNIIGEGLEVCKDYESWQILNISQKDMISIQIQVFFALILACKHPAHHPPGFLTWCCWHRKIIDGVVWLSPLGYW